MKVAIVDDESAVRARLKGFLLRYEEEKQLRIDVEEFYSGDALLNGYDGSYDIILFDIDMPGLNGFDTAKRIRESDERVIILFITNLSRYAISGYEVDAINYVLKPVAYPDFAMKMSRAFRKVAQRADNSVVIDTVDGPRSFFVSDIIYLEVFSHYLVIHTVKGDYKARGKMHDMETKLSPYNFFQIHRSYSVNLRYVSGIRANQIVVNGISLPIGRKHKSEFMQEYMKYIKG